MTQSRFLIKPDASGGYITSLTDGGFVVSWSERVDVELNGSLTSKAYAQRFNNFGNAVGSELQLSNSSDLTHHTHAPAIVGLTNGGFAAAWIVSDERTDNIGIFGRLYDNLGNAAGSDFKIDTLVTSSQTLGQTPIASLTDGGFVVIWYSFSMPEMSTNSGIYGQRYDSNGSKSGSESKSFWSISTVPVTL